MRKSFRQYSRGANAKYSLLDVIKVNTKRFIEPFEATATHDIGIRTEPQQLVGNLYDRLTRTSDSRRVRVPHATTRAELSLPN